MKKIFMYDTEGLYVVACQFVGVNECGEPQLVVMTPGEQVTSLETFMEDAEVDEMKLLCEEGEKLSSLQLVGALSPLIKFNDQFLIMDLINDVSDLGIEWSKEPVKVSFYISKSTDKDEEFPFSLQLMVCKQSGVVSCQNYFETLSEVLECISVFRKTFKVMADVELKMSLTFGRHYNPEVPDKYKTMFDEINYPYAE